MNGEGGWYRAAICSYLVGPNTNKAQDWSRGESDMSLLLFNKTTSSSLWQAEKMAVEST